MQKRSRLEIMRNLGFNMYGIDTYFRRGERKIHYSEVLGMSEKQWERFVKREIGESTKTKDVMFAAALILSLVMLIGMLASYVF